MATSVVKNVKKNQQQVAPTDLPPDMLQEIFLKLPVKSLIRFKGFLLLQNDVPEPVLVLCNPAMGSHTIVPYPDNFWNVDFYLSCSFRGGVVYDKFNDDYLVILGSVQVNGNVIIRKPQWKVFSVRTNSWKDIEGGDCFIPIVIHHRQLGLLYNEAIHWLAMYIGPVQRQGFVIVAFDTVTKTLSMIPLPYPQRPPDQMELSLLGGGGCFGICMMNNKIPEIWVMREYKVESSWTKLNIVLPCRNLVPLCFTKSDEVVAKLDGINHLIKCSGERVLEYCGLISCDPHPIVIMFTESLLSLPSSYRQDE
ncbi:hypothetical protein PIB30_033822 [Stylosanthes scabra]|uniref:F-box associated beta-propeller type 1 domain-containing protein n=1 Tax=Stylosanthes scabra TaxID=79078 RepID=A0ABU6YEK3_9FABA|nr:hypothetical protein [Stylosanthes scabra]